MKIPVKLLYFYIIMPTFYSRYEGNLRTSSEHLQSGTKIITDAPTDNQGKGEAFSPTDLLAVSLATCMLTTIAIKIRNNDFNIEGAEISATKIMASDPRRVAGIKIEFKMPPNNYTGEQKKMIEQIAHTCPVALSIHPDLKQEIIFNY
ncbi:MAG TPA: OsmC family protein [Bacteroidia bacterium]|nr:OsmC family protein [Bacteroidia bacterium]